MTDKELLEELHKRNMPMCELYVAQLMDRAQDAYDTPQTWDTQLNQPTIDAILGKETHNATNP